MDDRTKLGLKASGAVVVVAVILTVFIMSILEMSGTDNTKVAGTPLGWYLTSSTVAVALGAVLGMMVAKKWPRV